MFFRVDSIEGKDEHVTLDVEKHLNLCPAYTRLSEEKAQLLLEATLRLTDVANRRRWFLLESDFAEAGMSSTAAQNDKEALHPREEKNLWNQRVCIYSSKEYQEHRASVDQKVAKKKEQEANRKQKKTEDSLLFKKLKDVFPVLHCDLEAGGDSRPPSKAWMKRHKDPTRCIGCSMLWDLFTMLCAQAAARGLAHGRRQIWETRSIRGLSAQAAMSTSAFAVPSLTLQPCI